MSKRPPYSASSHHSCWGLMNGKGRWPVCFRLGRVIYFCVTDTGKTSVNLCGRVTAHWDSGPLIAQSLCILRKMHHLAGSFTSTHRDGRRWPPALGHHRGHVTGCDKLGGEGAWGRERELPGECRKQTSDRDELREM